jgi:hypothetical protein
MPQGAARARARHEKCTRGQAHWTLGLGGATIDGASATAIATPMALGLSLGLGVATPSPMA